MTELEEAKNRWNVYAEGCNRWDQLDSDEKFELWWKVFSRKTAYIPPASKEIAKKSWDAAIEEKK